MKIDLFRMSASRPWHIENTHKYVMENIIDKCKDHEIEMHLVESVLQPESSDECIKFANENGYKVHEIRPAKGQGYAIDYFLKHTNCKYIIKWEDDFLPETIIPIDICVGLMEKYRHINQICFNKRKTLKYKWISDENGKFRFEKEQREFIYNNEKIPLVVKDRWWFGTSIWRVDFIRPLFQYYEHNTHNYLNDRVIMPLAGFVMGDEKNGFKGRRQPTARQIETHIGCYIYGRHDDPRMAFHTGLADSLWYGDLQKRWIAEGKEVVGI